MPAIHKRYNKPDFPKWRGTFSCPLGRHTGDSVHWTKYEDQEALGGGLGVQALDFCLQGPHQDRDLGEGWLYMATTLAVSRGLLRQGPQWVWIQAPSPHAETSSPKQGLGGEGREREMWERGWVEEGHNSKCFSALAAEHAWKSRGWIFHTFENLPAPAKYDHFSLKCPPQQQIPLTPGWVWGASSLRTRVPDWTRDKLQPRRDKAQVPPEPKLGVGCWARVEALCGRGKEIGERQVQKRSWA